VPLKFNEYKVTELIANKLHLGKVSPMLEDWKTLVTKITEKREPIKIALVGKYTGLDDAYLSVMESLKIACYHQDLELNLQWIDSEKLSGNDEKTWEELKSADGILVPGGFGVRGTEGKIKAARYARENKVPYLGICLGLQIMTIEYARFKLKNEALTSEEFDEKGALGAEHHVIHFLPGQHKDRDKGATLRLGAYPCMLQEGSLAKDLYKKDMILERHRHRYEINNAFKKALEDSDWIPSGIYEEAGLVEIAELKNHPFMIGSQFHPEFLSRPHRPHPLFFGLIEASKTYKLTKSTRHDTVSVHSSK
jgi:CTP synthase